MKWIFLAFALAGLWPFSNWLRRSPWAQRVAWTAVGFLPFAITPFHLYMAVISWPQWPGYVKGAEVSVLDLLCAALYFSLPRSTHAVPFRFVMALYFLAVLLASGQSAVPVAALFYAWQLARVFLVYATVARGCAHDRVVPVVLTGMVLGLAYQAGDQLWAHFVRGVLQTGGSLGHQNLLGLMSHLVVFPCAALLLAGASNWRAALGPAAGLVTAVLTVSRATIGLAAGGYGALFVLSTLRQWTWRKALLIGTCACLAVILLPAVESSFEERFSQNPISSDSYDERQAFQTAAQTMLEDHPFGVGANYYVVAANVGGYNARAKVATAQGSEEADVHNIYLLVAAETGYLGLASFVLMLAQPVFLAFRYSWRARRDWRGDLLLGIGMSLIIVYAHSLFEWIFITFSPQYLFAIDIGMAAGLAMQLGYGYARAPDRATVAFNVPDWAREAGVRPLRTSAEIGVSSTQDNAKQ